MVLGGYMCWVLYGRPNGLSYLQKVFSAVYLVACLGEVDDGKLDECSEHKHEACSHVYVNRSVHEVGRERANATGSQSHYSQDTGDANRSTRWNYSPGKSYPQLFCPLVFS